MDAVIEAVLSELNAFKRNKKILEAFLPGDLSLTLLYLPLRCLVPPSGWWRLMSRLNMIVR